MAVGRGIKRDAFGSHSRKAAARTLSQRVRSWPIITLERRKRDSSPVKRVGRGKGTGVISVKTVHLNGPRHRRQHRPEGKSENL